MEAEESNTSTRISQFLTSLQICRLHWKSFWNVFISNIELHASKSTVASYLRIWKRSLNSCWSSWISPSYFSLSVDFSVLRIQKQVTHSDRSCSSVSRSFLSKAVMLPNVSSRRIATRRLAFSSLCWVTSLQPAELHSLSWLQSGWRISPSFYRTSSTSDFKTFTPDLDPSKEGP
jgi:hypothetical protein